MLFTSAEKEELKDQLAAHLDGLKEFAQNSRSRNKTTLVQSGANEVMMRFNYLI